MSTRGTSEARTEPDAVARGLDDVWAGHRRALLGFFVLGAIAVRWLRWEATAVIFNDGPIFLALAKAAAAGDWPALIAHPFHPLYSVAIAAVHTLGAPFALSWESAGALTSAFSGGAAVLALHAFVRRAFGPFQALFAAGVLAFHAVAIEQGGNVQSESLYLALFLSSAAYLWRALDERAAGHAFVGGLLAGLAYLTRPEGLSWLVVVGGVGLGLLVLRRWSFVPTLRWGLAAGVGALFCVAPYVGALWLDTGELWLTRKKSVAWVAGLDGPPRHFAGAPTVEPDWDALALPGGMESPGQRGTAVHESDKSVPARVRAERRRAEEPAPPLSARVAEAAGDLTRTSFRTLRYEVALLLVFGIAAVRGPPRLRAAFVGTVLGFHAVLLFGLALNVGYVSQRHALPPLMLLLGYAACGIPSVATGLSGVWRRPISLATAAAVTLAVLAALGVGKNVRPDGLDELAERRAAEWLLANAEERGPIATRKRRVAYYAELPFVQLRDKRLERFVHYLDTHDVRYVVVNTDDIEDYEGLAPLIGTWLTKVHVEEAEGETAWVLHYQPPHRPGAAAGP